MDKFVFGSVRHQKELARLIGYDYSKWNPNDDTQKELLFKKAVNALLKGKDCNGKWLSPDDMSLLSMITGRG